METLNFTVIPEKTSKKKKEDEDDEDDDEYFDTSKLKRINMSEIDRVFGPKTTPNGPEKRAIDHKIVIEEVNNDYNRNKRKKILESVNPEDKPEDLERWDTEYGGSKIKKLIKQKEDEHKRQEHEWNNPKKAFVNIIAARLNLKPTQLYSSAFDGMALPKKGDLGDILQVPKRRDADTGQPLFSLEEVTKEDRDNYRFYKDVRAVVKDDEVEGIIEIHPAIITGITLASAHLLTVDHGKFQGKNKWEHFLVSEDVSTMFGDLVSAIIALNSLLSPTIYNPVRTTDDRNRWKSSASDTLREKLVWKTHGKGGAHWEVASLQELEQNQIKNLQQDFQSIRQYRNIFKYK